MGTDNTTRWNSSGFYTSPWQQIGRKSFLLYRVLVFHYWLSTFVVDLIFNEDKALFLIYLSHWGQILILTYLGLSLMLLIIKELQSCNSKSARLETEEIDLAKTPISEEINETCEAEGNKYNTQGKLCTFLNQLTLIAMVLSFDFAVIITFLYPLLQDPSYNSSIRSINLHIINTVIVMVDVCVNAIPVRFINVFFTITASAFYGAMLLSLHAAEVTSSVYPCLNWKTKPLQTSIITAVMIIIAPLLAHAVLYGIYKLKLICIKKVLKTKM